MKMDDEDGDVSKYFQIYRETRRGYIIFEYLILYTNTHTYWTLS